MYLTSTALTYSLVYFGLQVVIASKVNVIAGLTLGVIPTQLGWGRYYAQGSLSGTLVSQLLRKLPLSKHGVSVQNACG